MGKIDILCKKLLNDNEVFADICNLLFHNGRRVVLPGNLVDVPTEHAVCGSPASGENVARRVRDTLKKCLASRGGPAQLLVGLEAQFQEDLSMPLRCLCYDAMCLLQQAEELKGLRKSGASKKYFVSNLLPGERVLRSVTAVVHFGISPPEGSPRVSDLMAPVEASWDAVAVEYVVKRLVLCLLSDEEIAALCLKLRCLAKCLKCAGDPDRLLGLLETDEDMRRMPSLVAALLGLIMNVNMNVDENSKEDVDMCYAIDELMRRATDKGRNEGFAKGHENGFAEGRENGFAEGHENGFAEGADSTMRQVAASMLSMRMPREDVVSFLARTFALSHEKAMTYV